MAAPPRSGRRGPRSISCSNIAGQIPELLETYAEADTASAPTPPEHEANTLKNTGSASSQSIINSSTISNPRGHTPGTPWKRRTDRSISFDDLPTRIAETLFEEPSLASLSSSDLEAAVLVAKPRTQWQPDKEAKHCSMSFCQRKFGPLQRRHHCRKCGRVVCGSCSKGRMQLYTHGGDAELHKERVCSICEGQGGAGLARSETSGSLDNEEGQSSSSANSDSESYWNGTTGGGGGGNSFSGGVQIAHGETGGDMNRSRSMGALRRQSRHATPSPPVIDPHSQTLPDDEYFPAPPSPFNPTPALPVTKAKESGWALNRSKSWVNIHLLGRLSGPSTPITSAGGAHTSTEDDAASESSRGSPGLNFEEVHKNRTRYKCVLPAAYTDFVWSGTHAMDSRGLLYYLATAGRTESYVNPAERGLGLKVRGSAWSEGSHQDVVCCSPNLIKNSWSTETPLGGRWAWFSVELPLGLCLQATHYTIRHGCFAGAALRNWQLQVSMDGENWTVAKEHSNDPSLGQRYAVHTFAIKVDCARFFKVVMTGRNDIGGTQLSCNGFELYGRVITPQQEGILKPMHWFWDKGADPT